MTRERLTLEAQKRITSGGEAAHASQSSTRVKALTVYRDVYVLCARQTPVVSQDTDDVRPRCVKRDCHREPAVGRQRRWRPERGPGRVAVDPVVRIDLELRRVERDIRTVTP